MGDGVIGMNPAFVSQDELAEQTGFKRQGDLERHLREEGIQFFRGKGNKIWTTIGLIEAAKLQKEHKEIEFG